ncbi:MAG: response regulator, partial [Candidatus Methylomirabilales bacterium]
MPFKYCPSCGEEVYTYTVQKEGEIEIRCSACGFPLSLEPGPFSRGLDCIMIADDDRFFRSLLAALLDQRGFTTNIIPCESGPEFLSIAAERFLQGLPIKLAILDIMMYPLDGVATALAFRALEKGLKVAPPTPILFLSAARSDETLRKLIGRCQPALYLNKGSDAT